MRPVGRPAGARQGQSRPADARPARRRLPPAHHGAAVHRACRHADVAGPPRSVRHRLRHRGRADRCAKPGVEGRGGDGGAPRRVASTAGNCALEKQVPAEAGLGGGSADAAAAARLVASAAGRSLDAGGTGRRHPSARRRRRVLRVGRDDARRRGRRRADAAARLPAAAALARPSAVRRLDAQAYGWYDDEHAAPSAGGRREPDAVGEPARCPAMPANDLEGARGGASSRDRPDVTRLREAGARAGGDVGQRVGVLRPVRPAPTLPDTAGRTGPTARGSGTPRCSPAPSTPSEPSSAVGLTGHRSWRSAFCRRRAPRFDLSSSRQLRVRYRFAHPGGRVPGGLHPCRRVADVGRQRPGGAQTPELGQAGASLADTGASPSGKARDFESRIRRFESFRPSQPVRARRVPGGPRGSGDGAVGLRRTAMARSNLKVFSGSAHPQLAQEICGFPVCRAGAGAPSTVSRHRGLVPDRREHPRHRRVHRAADVAARWTRTSWNCA